MTTPKERLLREARELFFELGFSRVSMDEIAAHLGMSKRTIYQIVPSKQDLLREGLFDKIREISDGLGEIVENGEFDFVEKLHQVGFFMVRSLPRPSRHFLRDMEQNCAPIWTEVDAERARVIQRRFGALFEQGKEQQILRQHLDSKLVVQAMLGMIQSTIRPEVLSHMSLSMQEAFAELFELLCLGLLTDAGRDSFLRNQPGGDDERT